MGVVSGGTVKQVKGKAEDGEASLTLKLMDINQAWI